MNEKNSIVRKKHKRKSKFWFGYRIFAGVLALLFVIMCIAVWNTMKKYEAAQPEKYMKKVVQKIEDGNYEDVSYTSGTANKFEPNLDYKKEFETLIAGKELDFKISAEKEIKEIVTPGVSPSAFIPCSRSCSCSRIFRSPYTWSS